MVLIGAYEYNPSLDTLEIITLFFFFFFQDSKDVGFKEGRYSDSNKFLEPLDGRCGTRSTEEQHMLRLRPAQLLPDVRLGFMDHPAHRLANEVVLSVGVP